MLILLSALFLLSSCSTWKAYDNSYDTSKGLVTIIQEHEPMMVVYNVDSLTRGMTTAPEIIVTPGPHVIGFLVNPCCFKLIPSDPNEEYNEFTTSIAQWISFNAEEGKTYKIVTPFARNSQHVRADFAVLVDVESDTIVSTLIGNYANRPQLP